MRERFAISVSQACRLALLRRSTWYRRSAAADQTPLRMRIRELAMTRPRFGYLRIHVLLRREGWAITTTKQKTIRIRIRQHYITLHLISNLRIHVLLRPEAWRSIASAYIDCTDWKACRCVCGCAGANA